MHQRAILFSNALRSGPDGGFFSVPDAVTVFSIYVRSGSFLREKLFGPISFILCCKLSTCRGSGKIT
jgi:hypothetical protein